MKSMLKIYPALLIVFSLLTACNKNDNMGADQNTEFRQGVFVVNEGNFSDADGEITFINFITGDVRHNVFKNANGRPLAAILQSFTIFDGTGYLVDQLGRVEKVDPTDFKSEGNISSGLTIPRYFAAIDGKAFVTDWGPYDADFHNDHSRIVKIDLANLEITDSVSTPSRPEGILISGEHVFVANSGSDVVSVYNVSDLKKVTEIAVPPGPTLLNTDKYGDIWTACTGNDSIRSAIIRINAVDMTVAGTMNLPEGIKLNGRQTINGTKDILYFMSEQWAPDFSYSTNTVFSQPVDQGTFSYASVISRKNLYGLGVDPDNNNIYVSDAKGFQTHGMIYAYDVFGTLLDSAQVDRGPRDFVFVNQ